MTLCRPWSITTVIDRSRLRDGRRSSWSLNGYCRLHRLAPQSQLVFSATYCSTSKAIPSSIVWSVVLVSKARALLGLLIQVSTQFAHQRSLRGKAALIALVERSTSLNEMVFARMVAALRRCDLAD